MHHAFKALDSVLFTSTDSDDSRTNAPATVIRQLTDDDRHWEAGPMYSITLGDGSTHSAFEDELRHRVEA